MLIINCIVRTQQDHFLIGRDLPPHRHILVIYSSVGDLYSLEWTGKETIKTCHFKSLPCYFRTARLLVGWTEAHKLCKTLMCISFTPWVFIWLLFWQLWLWIPAANLKYCSNSRRIFSPPSRNVMHYEWPRGTHILSGQIAPEIVFTYDHFSPTWRKTSSLPKDNALCPCFSLVLPS